MDKLCSKLDFVYFFIPALIHVPMLACLRNMFFIFTIHVWIFFCRCRVNRVFSSGMILLLIFDLIQERRHSPRIISKKRAEDGESELVEKVNDYTTYMYTI